MAKKKAPKKISRKEKIDNAVAGIQKKFGERAARRGSFMRGQENEVVSTGSLGLDEILRGGWWRGRIYEIFGDEAVGKCLIADTYLATHIGLLTIEELFEELGYKSACTSRVAEAEVSLLNRYGVVESTKAITWNNRRKVFKMTCSDGTEVTSTARHRHLVMDETGFHVWRKLEDIQVGDFVVLSKGSEAFGNGGADQDVAYALGILVADGYFGKNRISVTNDDPRVQECLRTTVGKMIGVVPLEYENGGSIDFHFNSKDGVEAFCNEWGFGRWRSAEKHLPRRIRMLDCMSTSAFLRGYFDCEAHYDGKAFEVASASHRLLREVKLILRNFEIHSTLKPKWVDGKEYWRLFLSGQDAKLFLFNMERFREIVWEDEDLPKGGTRSIPHISGLVRALVEGQSSTTAELWHLGPKEKVANTLFRPPTSV